LNNINRWKLAIICFTFISPSGLLFKRDLTWTKYVQI